MTGPATPRSREERRSRRRHRAVRSITVPVRHEPAPVLDHPERPDMSGAPHPWMPMAPCSPEQCLPARGTVPTVGPARRVARYASAAIVLLGGVFLAPVIPLLRGRARQRVIRSWFWALLRAFGIVLRIRGRRDFGDRRTGALVVTNHISWLDIVALNAVRPVRSVAKKEIRHWPVIGQLASSVGTVFVDRESLVRLPETVSEMAAAMRAGAKISVFPEGTTWCGARSGSWHPAAFQAAIDAGAPVQPVVLRFVQREHGPSTAAAFVGDMTLWDSLSRTAALRGLVIEIEILPALPTEPGQDRRELTRRAQQLVAGGLEPSDAAQAVPTPHEDAA